MEVDEPIFLLYVVNAEDGKRQVVEVLIVSELDPRLFVGPDDDPEFYSGCFVVSLRRVEPDSIVFVVVLVLEVGSEAGEIVEGDNLAGVEEGGLGLVHPVVEEVYWFEDGGFAGYLME